MSKMKIIQLAREVVMGPNVLKRVGEVCGRLCPGKNAFLVADEKTFTIAGSKIQRQLKNAGYKVNHSLIKEADMPTINRVRAASRKKADFFVGVGGGRAIDVAKLVSFQEGKPFVSVPTAASHDGIASSMASIKGGKKPTSVETHAPIAIVADTLVIKRAPHKLLAAGCGDLVSNLTAVRDWQLAHQVTKEPYSEYAATLALVSARLVLDNAEMIKEHSEESVRKVVKALISSSVAMAIAGSSRPASGSEHLFSHALNLVAPKPALHGEQCGVGAIMMAYLQGEDWKAIQNALKTVGAPTNAEELGIKGEHIVKALTMAHKIRPERHTVISAGLDRKTAKHLAEVTEVI
jgi:glycerol-1-phosphate dehydrogenase [NAD(P)+]